MPESIWALDEARGLEELFPVYQATVLGEPFTSEVTFAVMLVPTAVEVAVPLADENPNAPSAACAFGSEDEAVIEKLAAFGVLIVMAPLALIEDVPPVIELMADSRLPTEPVVGSML